MPSIWDMLFPGASQAPQFGGQDPNAQLPVPFPGPQQAPWLPQTTPWPQDAAPLTAQQRYRASQAGDESRLPQYERSGPTLPGGLWNNLVETATRVQTPPPQLPPGVTDTDFAGLAVKRDGQWVPWKEADPQAAGAYYEEMQKRADLPMNVAMGMVGGGTAFAPKVGALGTAGAKMLQPATTAGRDAAFYDAPYAAAKYGQYAEQYPPVGLPRLADEATNKPITGVSGTYLQPQSKAQKLVDTGAAFWQKQQTPEAKAFAKDRLAIMKDMQEKGYTPYLDPAQREHVDPANYPSNFDTVRDALPKKQATIDKYREMLDTPEGRARLEAGYEKGLTVPNSDRWYAMKQLEDEYRKEFGPEAGRGEFKRGFADTMAATTGGADPRSNFLMGQYGRYLVNRDRLTPPTHQMPYPIGGRFAYGNMQQFDKAMRDPAFTGFDMGNPKRHDFSYSFAGHPETATMDEQMSGGLVPNMKIPPGDSYGIASGVVRDLARERGVAPRDYQDVAWAGLKAQKEGDKFQYEGPMINQINDAVERTHRLTGMSRAEIMRRGIVRGDIPIYGLAAGVTAPLFFPQKNQR